MEQHKLVKDSANIHTSRSCMTSTRKHACMRNWKTTNPSSGLHRTTNIFYSAKRHTCAHASTHLLTYDKWTKENGDTHKSIIRARWNKTNWLLIQQTYTHLLVQAHARSRMPSAGRHVCMYEQLKIHTYPSSGLDGTAQTGDWLSKHTHICSCKHMLAHVWRVHEGMHVWKIENSHKSIIRARWNKTNWLLILQTYTHLLVQAHARACMTSARRHACIKIENTHKSIIRARWNNTNLLLIQQTYTHLLVQAHARSRMTSARRHACMKN